MPRAPTRPELVEWRRWRRQHYASITAAAARERQQRQQPRPESAFARGFRVRKQKQRVEEKGEAMIAIGERVNGKPFTLWGVTRAEYENGYLRLWQRRQLVFADNVTEWKML